VSEESVTAGGSGKRPLPSSELIEQSTHSPCFVFFHEKDKVFFMKKTRFAKNLLVPKQGVAQQGSGEASKPSTGKEHIHTHEINYISYKNSGYFKVNA